MKYFNKEWYELMQKQFMTDGITEILDKDYSNKEIEELYNIELKKEIERAYEDYNTPPDYSFLEEILNEQFSFNPEDWIIVSEDEETLIVPNSKEELLKMLLKEKEKNLEEFNNRGNFNEKEVIDYFEKSYKTMLEVKDFFPEWVYDEVDNRLIALNLLPKNILKKLRAEEKVNKKKYEKIIKKANKDLSRQDKDRDLFTKLSFHDYRIIGFDKKEDNYEMTIENYEDNLIKIIFENAKIIEYEDIDFKNCFWLYEEVYKNNNMYEVHLMVDSNGLKYLTLECKEIKGI